MLGIDWLTKNAAKWNFLDGTIRIREPRHTLRETDSSHAEIGRELSVRSVYTLKSDCSELAFDRVVLPTFKCAIPKEVMFRVLNKICSTARINNVVKIMLTNFV